MSEYFRQMEPLSRKFSLFTSFRNFSAIFAPSNSYFTEKSRWVPLMSCEVVELNLKYCLKNELECIIRLKNLR